MHEGSLTTLEKKAHKNRRSSQDVNWNKYLSSESDPEQCLQSAPCTNKSVHTDVHTAKCLVSHSGCLFILLFLNIKQAAPLTSFISHCLVRCCDRDFLKTYHAAFVSTCSPERLRGFGDRYTYSEQKDWRLAQALEEKDLSVIVGGEQFTDHLLLGAAYLIWCGCRCPRLLKNTV